MESGPAGLPAEEPQQMRLALKFAVALSIGMCAVLAVYAYYRIEGDREVFEADMRRDQRLVGHTLLMAAEEAWRRGGESEAVELIRRIDLERSHVSIRWTRPGASPESLQRPMVPAAAAAALEKREVVAGTDRENEKSGYYYTYFPLRVDGEREGAIELVESLRETEAHVRLATTRILQTTGALAGVSALLAVALGFWLVGRPTRKLIERARLVGIGDLKTRIRLRQRDEFSELAKEINAMCDRLLEANSRVETETAARIATIEQLRHADRLATVGQLASGIAHELGTPLNVIWARAKMVAANEAAGDEARANARIVAEQAEQMTKIIRQLLDFARPRSPRKAPVDLWRIVRQIEGLLQPMAGKRRVSIRRTGDESPVMAHIDAYQLQQVLSNLIVNAIQAMPDGGQVEIDIGRARARSPDPAGREGEYYRLTVRDQGVGMDEETRRHLFEPFFTRKGIGEGTGLGLSVSLGIVREHGGWIGVESEPDRGSSFSVYLPADESAPGSA